jgi:hypothetical protein
MWLDLTETAAQDAALTESYGNFGLVATGDASANRDERG